jgi:hypothetical protein
MRRRPDAMKNASIELAFALAAYACGLFDAPVMMVGVAGVGMLAYWTWSRRLVLNRLRGATWITVSTVGTIAIIAIIGGAYWLGLASGGTI